jgi:hypothetical protein
MLLEEIKKLDGQQIGNKTFEAIKKSSDFIGSNLLGVDSVTVMRFYDYRINLSDNTSIKVSVSHKLH